MIGRPAASLIDGPAGAIEVVDEAPADVPSGGLAGLAVIAHPHPLMGGTLDNKVVHTLSRAFVQQGWRAVRFNFRGVGASQGAWDEGRGEIDDFLAVLAHYRLDTAQPKPSIALAGFSFGGHVAAAAADRLARLGQPVERLLLVSPSVANFATPAVPADTLLVQGELDDVVPLAAMLDWARPQGLPVIVVPGAGHFFHGQLGTLKQIVSSSLSSFIQ